MPAQLRVNQTVRFTVNWKDANGNPALPPTGPLHTSVSDPSKATVQDNGDGSYTLVPAAEGNSLAVSVIAADNVTAALGLVTISGGVAKSGDIVFDAPTPP